MGKKKCGIRGWAFLLMALLCFQIGAQPILAVAVESNQANETAIVVNGGESNLNAPPTGGDESDTPSSPAAGDESNTPSSSPAAGNESDTPSSPAAGDESNTPSSSPAAGDESNTPSSPAAGDESNTPFSPTGGDKNNAASPPTNGGGGNAEASPAESMLPMGDWNEPQLENGEFEVVFFGIAMMNNLLLRKEEGEAIGTIPHDISEEIVVTPKVWINGRPYDKDNWGAIEAVVGQSFSYSFQWELKENSAETIGEGTCFEKTIFEIPGLTLHKNLLNQKMVIQGIHIGNWNLTYNAVTGALKFEATFNRYAGFFDSNTIVGFLRGSGKFANAVDPGTDATLGETGGTITVTEPEKPSTPDVPPGGTGWRPSTAPEFNADTRPFGKGIKWNSSPNTPNAEPWIEWRMVFLDYLQERQAEFIDGTAPAATTEYCIIEDTLDANMDFTQDSGELGKYENGAPFFFEIPVMIPGTGNVLNGNSSSNGYGNNEYDGAGMINLHITGKNFTKLSSEEAVKENPMTWAVVTDQDTGTKKLIINVGPLGLTEAENAGKTGMTFSMAKGSNWNNVVAELNKKIVDAQNKADALDGGEDSPVSLLSTRAIQLEQEVNRIFAMGLPGNDADKQEAARKFFEDYKTWRGQVDRLTPFLDEDGMPLPGVPAFPDYRVLRTIVINAQGQDITYNKKFSDFAKSVDNLFKDQSIYLKNRMDYKNGWLAAKENYERTRDFYQNGQIFGFVMKYATKITNTSVDTFSNHVKVSLGNRTWEAEDSLTQKYNSGVTGNYQVGSYVVQKADSVYATGDAKNDILAVEKEKSGLAGAVFQLYCGDDQNPHEKPDFTTEEHLAHFWPKEASENRDTYRYNHTGTSHPNDSGLGKEDEVSALKTGYVDENGNTVDNGRLALSNIAKASKHDHWLIETAAPKGYYTSNEPIQLDIQADQVNYLLVPNVARAVSLQKEDSNSGQPIAGAEFELYQADGDLVTGFVTKTMKGHTFYWQQDGGRETLKTNADGYLYIHGLDAGSYYLQEKTPAPGYKPQAPKDPYPFTLAEMLPETATLEDGFYRIKVNNGDAVENDPKTAHLSIGKKSLVGPDEKYLEDAYFALFRWKGTEAAWKEWQQKPGDMRNWDNVTFQGADSLYYQTSNQIGSISVDIDGTQRALSYVASDADGKLNISEIPLGHYFIIEVKAPLGYQRNELEYYFNVDKDTVDEALQLYRKVNGTNPMENINGENIVRNSSKLAQLALIKYDGVNGPTVTGGEQMPSSGGQWDETADGWKYGDGAIDTTQKGLPDATYKIFRQYGPAPNPNPKDRKNTDSCEKYTSQYDLALAIGTTDENGVLRLEDMHGGNGVPVQGLTPANYYMIEMKAPDGYILDETPILFPINQNSMKDGEMGLIKRVKNQQAEYGISILKVDEETYNPDKPEEPAKTLSGTVFTITEKDAKEPLQVVMIRLGQYRVAEAGDASTMATMLNDLGGSLRIQGLEKGKTYLLKETLAPHGYAKPDAPVEIIVDEETEPDNGVYYTYRVVPNEKQKGVVKLSKVDGDTHEPLEGAEFTLYRLVREEIKPGDPDYEPGGSTNERFSEEVIYGPKATDENGEVTFEGLDWSPDYFLRETKPPDGYLLNETALWFEIDQYSFDIKGEPIPVLFPNLPITRGSQERLFCGK